MSETNGSLALEQKVIVIEASEQPQPCKLRVAAYARVSSASDDQENSFGAQMRYFTTLISANESWTLADIYADEGITGTSVEKRDDFKRLLADCRRGLVDKVLTKSVSRFARNAKECLEAVRELKALGVGVVFEKENIDTGSMSSEMTLAFFASFAQAESESISDNMRWSYKRRMESGEFLPPTVPYGYIICDRKISINEEQAAVVRRIYAAYLSGCGMNEIANELNAENIPVRTGNEQRKWYHTAISYILSNERYIGDSLWQKTFTTDTLPFSQMHNRGERPQYYATDSHPAILSEKVFNAVQALKAERKETCGAGIEGESTVLRRRLICEKCNSPLRRKVIRENVCWLCQARCEAGCDITPIRETEIHAAFLRLFYNLSHEGSAILQNMLDTLTELRERQMLWSPDIIDLNKRICDLSEQNRMLTELKSSGLVDSDFYLRRSNELAAALREAKLKKERLLSAVGDDSIARTQELLEALDTAPEFLEEFDEGWFDELVEHIVVQNNETLRFRLKNGLELQEKLERSAR